MRILKDTSDSFVIEDIQVVTKKVLSGRTRLGGILPPKSLVQREIKALQTLFSMPDIQRLRAQISDTVFQSDFEIYPSLTTLHYAPHSFFERLQNVFAEMEKKGVFRVGMNRDDILVKPDGNPFLIDFGDVIFEDEHPVQIALAKSYTRWRIHNLQKRFGKR